MKKLSFISIVLLAICGFSQPPANYYSSATGTGYQLKTQLHNIIKVHNQKSYNALWNLYKHSAYRDLYYENDNTLLDVYSEIPDGPDAYSYVPGDDQCGNYGAEGGCYNREHVIPKSVFNDAQPMYADAHHILPTDGYVNGMRSNHPIGKVNSTAWTSTNGSKRGTSAVPGYTGTVFEPIDEFKGDFARIYFYFATRYQDKIKNWNFAMFNGTNDKVFASGFLDMLLQWHENDPVSPREIAINNRVYQHQGNRNPFIDNPSFVHNIWGHSSTYSVDSFYSSNVYIYPNPSKGDNINISSDKEIQEIKLININGQIIRHIKKPLTKNNVFVFENLPIGFYILRLNIEDYQVVKKIVVN